MRTRTDIFLLIILLSVLSAGVHSILPLERGWLDYRKARLLGTEQQRDDLYPVEPGLWYDPAWDWDMETINPDSGKIIIGVIPGLEAGDNQNLDLYSYLNISIRNISLINSMRLNRELRNDPDFVGKRWRDFVGYTEESFIQYVSPESRMGMNLLLAFGRIHDIWGPGRTGQLIMSSMHRPLDQVLLKLKLHRFSIALKTARLDNHVTAIDGHADSTIVDQRWLSASRVGISGSRWRLALNQAVVYGGEGQALEYAYMSPLILLYGEQANGPELKANILGSIDGRYWFDNSSVYFELLFDDFQVENSDQSDLEPPEVGVILGIEWARKSWYAGIEYAALTNRTYKTSDMYNARRSDWYTHRGEMPIGYAEGSDLWRLNGIARFQNDSHLIFDLEMDYCVRGEGEMNRPWDAPWQEPDVTMATGYDEPFPTGVLEKTSTINASVTWQWNHECWAGIFIEQARTENFSHQAGQTKNDTSWGVKCYWALYRVYD